VSFIFSPKIVRDAMAFMRTVIPRL
jgi:hypothetical protein